MLHNSPKKCKCTQTTGFSFNQLLQDAKLTADINFSVLAEKNKYITKIQLPYLSTDNCRNLQNAMNGPCSLWQHTEPNRANCKNATPKTSQHWIGGKLLSVEAGVAR